jgi:hypothetical protein
MDHDPTPPAFADLDWLATDTRFTASVTELFWAYRRLAQGELYKAGVSVTKIDDAWTVVYDPARDKTGFAALVPELRSRLHAQAMLDSDRDAEYRRKSEEFRQRQQAARIERELWFSGKVDEARNKAKDCLSRWGEFTVQKARLHKLAAAETLGYSDFREIDRIVRQTVRKAEKKKADAAGFEGGVTWPSEIIVDALRFLTEQDDDRASVQNRLGWSSSDSSTGHWCLAMIGSDPDRAVAVGRTIVGKYERQLRDAGMSIPA